MIKKSAMEELEKLKHEDDLRIEHTHGADTIFADLSVSTMTLLFHLLHEMCAAGRRLRAPYSMRLLQAVTSHGTRTAGLRDWTIALEP